jgi:hypothetical protein
MRRTESREPWRKDRRFRERKVISTASILRFAKQNEGPNQERTSVRFHSPSNVDATPAFVRSLLRKSPWKAPWKASWKAPWKALLESPVESPLGKLVQT